MDVFPKFIIEDGNLILAKVTYHNQLVTDKDKVKGGGWFKFNQQENKFVFYGDSHDFGAASFDDIKNCVEGGKVFNSKYLHRNISHKHHFAYFTGTETIDFVVKDTKYISKELKFKGVCVDTGKVVYGYGACNIPGQDAAYVIHKQGINAMQLTKVVPESLCQKVYTSDNRMDVYENDILSDGKNQYLVWTDNGMVLFGGVDKEWDQHFGSANVNDMIIVGNKICVDK